MARWLHTVAALCLLVTAQAAVDNSGYEFVLCFMDNYITGTPTFDIEIYVTTASNNIAQVNVTTPLFDPGFLAQTTVQRGNIEILYVPSAIRGEGVQLQNLGVYISASEEITVYSVNKEKYSTDGFIAYPVDAIGSDYIAATWDTVPEIMVAGVTDGTDVTMEISTSFTGSFAYNGATYGAGSTLAVTIDRFQTFHIYSDTGDLSGTRITSTQPITAMSGNFKTAVKDTMTTSTSDHLVEQLIPVQSFGKDFVTFPSPDRTVGDYVRVFAADDATTYTINGASYVLDRNGYNTHNFPSGEYYWVSSDKGVLCVMYSKTIGDTGTNDGPNGGDPAMSMVPAAALYGSDYTWSTVTTTTGQFTNYIIVVTLKTYKDDIVLDNSPMSASWVDVIGNTDYAGAVVSVSPGAHSIYNSVPAHTFLGIAYGNAQYNSYAYASGLRLAPVNLPCTPTAVVAGDGVDNDCDGKIDEETDNGADDDGDGQIDEDLAIPPRVDGVWGDWNTWSSCTSTCGSLSGTQTRTRACDNPAPANFGLDCPGDDTETGACTGPSNPCPVDGNWGSWSSWGTCGVTCGSGYQTRNRSCDNPAAAHGGLDCSGLDTDAMLCTISSYCLPSLYGNLDLNCGNLSFACATGSIQCIDLAFRCDGRVDCDDGTDESLYFTGCNIECKNGADHVTGLKVTVVMTALLLVCAFKTIFI